MIAKLIYLQLVLLLLFEAHKHYDALCLFVCFSLSASLLLRRIFGCALQNHVAYLGVATRHTVLFGGIVQQN